MIKGLITLFLLIVGIGIINAPSADAVTGRDWRAGLITDDGIFRNNSSMSVSEIQNFLNAKVPHCDTWGTKPSEFGGGTRAQWGTPRGYSPPYTCLRNYTENGKSAAQIIYDYAQQYRINPQVMLALLQKEQNLVTDEWPLNTQYRSATGYGCPDTAACDTQYYGFANQVRWASRMFQAITDNDPGWYTPYVTGNNYVRWNPISSCGGTTVNIETRSTSALYNYTPYQPNQAALNNLYGSGDGCSSYGNRNYWRLFNDWFGSTIGKWIYNDDNDGLINGIDLCKDDNGHSNINGCPVGSMNNSNTVSGDFNGDSYGDVLAFSVFPDGRTFNVWLFPGSASGLGSPVFQRTLGPNNGGWSFEYSKSVVTNVNNDAYDDLVIFHRGPNNEIVRHVLAGSASGIQASNPANVAWQFPADGWTWNNIRLVGGGDFNGDGYGDVLAFSVSQDGANFTSWIYPGSSTGGLLSPINKVELRGDTGGWSFKYAKPVVTNVNNDTYDDLVIFHRGPNNEIARHVLLGASSGIQSSNQSMLAWQFPAQGWLWSSVRPIGGGDFNGDGYGDVLAFSVFPDGRTFNVWLFPGSASGLGSPVFQRTLGPYNGGWLYGSSKPIITNVNNDAYDDLVIFHRGPNNEIVRHVLAGSASGIQASNPASVAWQFPAQGWLWSNVRSPG